MTEATTTADTEIRAVLAERERAVRTRDADALGALFTDDLVTFSLAPPLESQGRDVEGLRAWLATFDGAIEFEITQAVVETDGDIAFVHSLNRLSSTPKGHDIPFALWFRSTLGLRRVDGRWLIAHDHGSTPFDMDPSSGFRAAIDLTP